MENKNVCVQSGKNDTSTHAVITPKTAFGDLLTALGLQSGEKRPCATPKRNHLMCVPTPGADLRQQIHDAVKRLNAQISDVKTNEVFKFSDKQVTMTASELRPFSFFKDDKGDIYLKGGESKLGKFDVSKVMDSKSKDYERMTAFIDLRDTVRELLKVQAEDRPENEIKAVQQKLSTQYDDFYKKYGLLHSRKNRQVLRDDCSYNLLLTLEKEFDKDKLIAKSDIFTKRTVRPSKPIEHVDITMSRKVRLTHICTRLWKQNSGLSGRL